jgi:hypothetical protein
MVKFFDERFFKIIKFVLTMTIRVSFIFFLVIWGLLKQTIKKCETTQQ